ncbi:hypothetical protein [Streptomyces sp. NPDC002853]
MTRSVALTRVDDHLESQSAKVCEFVPMQSATGHDEQILLVNGTPEIALRFDDGLPAEPTLLARGLTAASQAPQAPPVHQEDRDEPYRCSSFPRRSPLRGDGMGMNRRRKLTGPRSQNPLPETVEAVPPSRRLAYSPLMYLLNSL